MVFVDVDEVLLGCRRLRRNSLVLLDVVLHAHKTLASHVYFFLAANRMLTWLLYRQAKSLKGRLVFQRDDLDGLLLIRLLSIETRLTSRLIFVLHNPFIFHLYIFQGCPVQGAYEIVLSRAVDDTQAVIGHSIRWHGLACRLARHLTSLESESIGTFTTILAHLLASQLLQFYVHVSHFLNQGDHFLLLS